MTPTQVRVVVDSPSYELSFTKVEFLVGEHRLQGGIWESSRDRTVYRFERPLDVEITGQEELSLEWKYEVTMHKDYKSPIHLADISERPQQLTTTVGGYEVNQTYIKQNGDSIPSRPITVNFTGDGDNKIVEVQQDYKGNEADVYLYHYYVDHPNQLLKVKLQ